MRPFKERRWLISCFLVAVSLVTAYRLLHLIAIYAVDLLFMDAWLFDKPLFRGSGWLALFRQQNGPHREGLGLFVTGPLAALTGWNMRAESFAVAVIVLAALAAAFLLKRRLWGEWDWSDAVLPLMFLTPVQFGTFFGAPQPAHSALPLLLLMLYCLAWLARQTSVRYSSIVVLNFLMIYTGFGIFIGLMTPLLLVVACRRARQEGCWREFAWAKVALLLSLLSAASFLIGYQFNPAADNFRAFHPRPWEYLGFAILLPAHFLGVSSVDNLLFASVLGAGLFLLMLAVGILHAREWLRRGSELSLIIAVLEIFSLLFCLVAAYGRIGFGFAFAESSRYATLQIPAFLGLYFHGLSLRSDRPRTVWLIALSAALAWGCLVITPREASQMAAYRDGKLRWKAAYLQTGSITEANRLARYTIIPPRDGADTLLAEELDYLRYHHLNLFRGVDAPFSAGPSRRTR